MTTSGHLGNYTALTDVTARCGSVPRLLDPDGVLPERGWIPLSKRYAVPFWRRAILRVSG